MVGPNIKKSSKPTPSDSGITTAPTEKSSACRIGNRIFKDRMRFGSSYCVMQILLSSPIYAMM